MTNEDRQVWRDAYDLYDWNHLMANTEANWAAFMSALQKFAENNQWQSRPLVRALVFGVYDAIDGEIKQREAAAREAQEKQNQQLSFL